MHIVASRQTATATSILRVLLAAAGKDIRLKADGVSKRYSGNDRDRPHLVSDKCVCVRVHLNPGHVIHVSIHWNRTIIIHFQRITDHVIMCVCV